MANARLIAFEGADCSGKSTLIREAEEWLTSQPALKGNVLNLHSPGETELGKKLAEVAYGGTPICKEAMRFIMAADTAQMHREIITGALEAGKVVLVSRNRLSDYVYGTASGVELSFMVKLLELIPFQPSDITFLCRCSYKTMLERKRQRASSDRFEKESTFSQKVWQLYDALGRSEADHGLLKLVSRQPLIVLDTDKPAEDSMALVKAVLAKELFGGS